MNGAELPCGSVLQVQLSDPNYSESKSRYLPQKLHQDPPTTTTDSRKNPDNAPPHEKEPSTIEDENKDDGDSDLDDFFESLA